MNGRSLTSPAFAIDLQKRSDMGWFPAGLFRIRDPIPAVEAIRGAFRSRQVFRIVPSGGSSSRWLSAPLPSLPLLLLSHNPEPPIFANVWESRFLRLFRLRLLSAAHRGPAGAPRGRFSPRAASCGATTGTHHSTGYRGKHNKHMATRRGETYWTLLDGTVLVYVLPSSAEQGWTHVYLQLHCQECAQNRSLTTTEPSTRIQCVMVF